MSSYITDIMKKIRSDEAILPVWFFTSLVSLPSKELTNSPNISIISCLIETYIVKLLFSSIVPKELKPYAIIGIIGVSAIGIVHRLRNNMISKDIENKSSKFNYTSPVLSIMLSLPFNSSNKKSIKDINNDLDDMVRVSYDMHKLLSYSGGCVTECTLTSDLIMDMLENGNYCDYFESTKEIIKRIITNPDIDLSKLKGIFIHDRTKGYYMITTTQNDDSDVVLSINVNGIID